MREQPTISVVTINFNNRDGLRTTMASVLAQTYANIEYIVIDGGSTDGSAEVIRPHAASLAYWVSEPDGGIYAAINKGMQFATGNWVIFMNAGDRFVSTDVVQKIFTSPIPLNTDFIFGDRIVEYDGYRVLDRAREVATMWKGLPFSHQSVFIRTEYQRAHPYHSANRIAADFEFFVDAYVAKLSFLHWNGPIAFTAPGGLSDRARIESIAARYRVVRKMKPGLRIHAYHLLTLGWQSIKLTIKRMLPQSLIDLYRKRFRKLI